MFSVFQVLKWRRKDVATNKGRVYKHDALLKKETERNTKENLYKQIAHTNTSREKFPTILAPQSGWFNSLHNGLAL